MVSLHVPATPATKGMIGPEQIARMRPGAFIINNARGNVIDLDALVVALDEDRLAGAAIDVVPPTRSSRRVGTRRAAAVAARRSTFRAVMMALPRLLLPSCSLAAAAQSGS